MQLIEVVKPIGLNSMNTCLVALGTEEDDAVEEDSSDSTETCPRGSNIDGREILLTLNQLKTSLACLTPSRIISHQVIWN